MNYVEDVNYCSLEREKVAEFESEKKKPWPSRSLMESVRTADVFRDFRIDRRKPRPSVQHAQPQLLC